MIRNRYTGIIDVASPGTFIMDSDKSVSHDNQTI